MLASVAAVVSARSHARDLPGTVDLILAASELAAAAPGAVDTSQVRCLARALAQSAERAIRSEGQARGRFHRRATSGEAKEAGTDDHQIDMAVLDAAQAELVSTLASPAAVAVLEFVVTHTESPELLASWDVLDIPLVSAEVIGANPHAQMFDLLRPSGVREARPRGCSPRFHHPLATPETPGRARDESPAWSPERLQDGSWTPESAVTASPSSAQSERRRRPQAALDRSLCVCEPRLGLVAIAAAASQVAESDVARLAGWVALETCAATLELCLARAGWSPEVGPDPQGTAARLEVREAALAMAASAAFSVAELIVSWLGRAAAAPRPLPRAVMVARSVRAGAVVATIACAATDAEQGAAASQPCSGTAVETSKFPAKLSRSAASSLPVDEDEHVALHEGFAASGVESATPSLAAARAGLMVRCFLASASPGTESRAGGCGVGELLAQRLLAAVVTVVHEVFGIDGAGVFRERKPKKHTCPLDPASSYDAAGTVIGSAAECARLLGSAMAVLSLVHACIARPAEIQTKSDPFEGRSPGRVSSALECGREVSSLWGCPLPQRCRFLAQALVKAATGQPAGAACRRANAEWKDLAVQVGVADASVVSNAMQVRSALLRGASKLLRGRAKRQHSRWRQALYAGLACALPQDTWLQQAESEWIASESAVDGRSMLAALTGILGKSVLGAPGPNIVSAPRSSLEAAASILRFAADQDSSSAVRQQAVVASRSLLSPGSCPAVHWGVSKSLLARLFDEPGVALRAADALGSCVGGLAGVASFGLAAAGQRVSLSLNAAGLLPVELKASVAVALQSLGSAQVAQVLGALIVVAEDAAARHRKSSVEEASQAAQACHQLGETGSCIVLARPPSRGLLARLAASSSLPALALPHRRTLRCSLSSGPRFVICRCLHLARALWLWLRCRVCL